ncbi:type II secretion system F family protein [Sphingomonas sp. LY29]|uniref:type II secretion system F family protein n=1 Tax=Sphingomonas sp. LY29 TaxID=3095341 RepID=UPI002D780636|nr:type II secretion system F family protein [Sphingomonas sp. LY29]WRP24825.1 type II secretion system F family protein [Sphingomonas sp. LY29]
MIDFLANDATRFAMLLLLFLAVGVVAFALIATFSDRQQTRERLVSDRGNEVSGSVDMGAALRTHDARGAWVAMVTAIERAGIPLVDTKDASLRTKLVAAGYTQEAAPRVYSLVRLIGVIGVPVGVFLFLWSMGSTPSITKLYFIGAISALMGLYVPSLWVRIRADRRQREIINAFPDALDLMLVCVEAGLGLEAAFNRVGMEMTRSHPLLAEQLGTVVLELRAGRSQEDALRRMADRAGADEIRAFATLLIQSQKLGSSVAQTLRTYASEMREKRRMRAEEKAHRLPVLLSIPLVVCMLPVMIGVLMLPAVIRTMRVIMPALGS